MNNRINLGIIFLFYWAIIPLVPYKILELLEKNIFLQTLLQKEFVKKK